MYARLRSWFWTGLLVTVPAAVTLWFFWWSWSQVDHFALRFLQGNFYKNVPGAGAVTVLAIVMLIGAMARSWLGSRVVALYEWILMKTPVVSTVFKSMRDMAGMIFDERSDIFREVVLFEYPRRGVWTIGFVAAPSAQEICQRTGDEDSIAVFVATSPNPTSGMLVFVARSACIELEMTAEEAFKLVMSGGLITPEVAAVVAHAKAEEA